MAANDLMLVVSLLVSLSALILSLLQRRDLEIPLKRSAALVAEGLRLAEPWIPALRNSQIDNYIRDVLKAYAESDPFFLQSLEATGETPDHVADVLPVLDPELKTLGKAMSLPVDKARTLMADVVHRVKEYDQVVQQIREELERSLDPSS